MKIRIYVQSGRIELTLGTFELKKGSWENTGIRVEDLSAFDAKTQLVACVDEDDSTPPATAERGK